MTTFYVDIQDKSFDKRIKYVFNFIQNHPLADKKVAFHFDHKVQNSTIHYGNKTDGHFNIPAQQLIFNHTPTHPAELIPNLYSYQYFELYSTEIKKRKTQDFLIQNLFSFDIIETIFFHISRYEEHISPADMTEKWGLGFLENHFIPRNQLQEIPIVDHLVYAFLDAIGAQPTKKATTYRLSHDVDNPIKLPSFYKLIKASGRLLLIERKGLKAQWKLFNTYRKMKQGSAKDPYDTFDWLFRKEALEKVVYFMAGGITKFDNFYKIDSPIGRRLLKEAKEKNYKIGIHPSYEAYANEELYQKEKQQLEEVSGERIVLARQHYLRFQFPKTADIIDNQGIREDSTLGYRDMIGFRCGTGYGYRLYNFEKEAAYDFVEVPLIIMEWGLIVQENYDFERIEKHLDSFIKKNQHLTKVTILFHNSIFDMVEPNRQKLIKIYKKLAQQIDKAGH